MDELRKKLTQMDGKSYKMLKSIQGSYKERDFTLHIDYVQGDPFASPSKVRVVVPFSHEKRSTDCLSTDVRKIAVEDMIARFVNKEIKKKQVPRMGTGKGGLVVIDSPGQEVLDRTAVNVNPHQIDIRLSIGLPANGRRIRGKDAATLLTHTVPVIVTNALEKITNTKVKDYVILADNQEAIRKDMKKHNIVSFIANGSILPRESGVSNKPLKDAVPFHSPDAFEHTVHLPDGSTITGMAIPQGITLIAGGGYHGKSTLLKAIERGVYNHILEDGREYVLTEQSAVKIKAEDGRSVHDVDITPFITNLPFNKDTQSFSTDDASGSTSQAASIVEALEMKCTLMLMDEDTSATNFMIRDARMQKLVANEPITPYLDHVKQLSDTLNISTILAIGGSGDYFEAADHVIQMDHYKPFDKTKQAKEIAGELKNNRLHQTPTPISLPKPRRFDRPSFVNKLGHKQKVDAKGKETILFNRTPIDLSHVEQIIDQSQTRALAVMLKRLSTTFKENDTTVMRAIDHLYEEIDHKGLDVLGTFKGQHPGDLALPRKQELVQTLNRFRRHG
nr:ABC-ATPase domain-containing protein [Alteribacter aurantiacus]